MIVNLILRGQNMIMYNGTAKVHGSIQTHNFDIDK